MNKEFTEVFNFIYTASDFLCKALYDPNTNTSQNANILLSSLLQSGLYGYQPGNFPNLAERIESTLLAVDDTGKKYIFTKLFRCVAFFGLCADQDVKLYGWAESLEGGIRELQQYGLCNLFELMEMCRNFGIQFSDVSNDDLDDLLSNIHIQSIDLFTIRKQPEKYQTIPRTHRIEAVKLLLKHMGIVKEIDRTQIAYFVEAVTGGNINVKPKNTESYKSHSKEAEASAKELLKGIGIEIK